MPEVKEHATLFKAEMVLATLTGLKWMTRRIVTQHNSLIDGTGKGIRAHWPHLQWSLAKPMSGSPTRWIVPCKRCGLHHIDPRVQAGDVLWGRETWALGGKCAEVRAADVPKPDRSPDFVRYRASQEKGLYTGRWRPAIHMPRWASRLVLPVIRGAAERVQDISKEDARAEGIPDTWGEWRAGQPKGMEGHEWDNRTSEEQFEWLWDSINGSKPGCAWKDNPPVWIYEWHPLKGDRP